MKLSREQWLAEMTEILGVEQEDVLEVAAMFFEAIDERLAASANAYQASDMRELTRLVHGLKGDAANIGFKEISQIARVLEMQSRDGTLHDFPTQFAALERAVATQKQYLALDADSSNSPGESPNDDSLTSS